MRFSYRLFGPIHSILSIHNAFVSINSHFNSFYSIQSQPILDIMAFFFSSLARCVFRVFFFCCVLFFFVLYSLSPIFFLLYRLFQWHFERSALKLLSIYIFSTAETIDPNVNVHRSLFFILPLELFLFLVLSLFCIRQCLNYQQQQQQPRQPSLFLNMCSVNMHST